MYKHNSKILDNLHSQVQNDLDINGTNETNNNNFYNSNQPDSTTILYNMMKGTLKSSPYTSSIK